MVFLFDFSVLSPAWTFFIDNDMEMYPHMLIDFRNEIYFTDHFVMMFCVDLEIRYLSIP